jgi:hypothetical protein
MDILLRWEDPTIFLQVVVDLRGAEDIEFLVNASPPVWFMIDRNLTHWFLLHCH